MSASLPLPAFLAVIGGFDKIDKIQEFDGTIWTDSHRLSESRYGHACSMLDTSIWVFGGTALFPETVPMRLDVETYTEAFGAATMPGRSALSSQTVGTSIYLLGGRDERDISQNTCFKFTPDRDMLTACADMIVERASFASAVLDGLIYVIGGDKDGEYLTSVETYDTESDRWTLLDSGLWLPTARTACGAAATYGGFIYIFGGNDDRGVMDSVMRFDGTKSWESVASMPRAQAQHSVSLHAGRMYVSGGNDGSRELALVVSYDPEKDSWREEPSLVIETANACSVAFV
jgi:hypothetical protein